MKFKILFPNGDCIDQNTIIKGLNNRYKITTNEGICKIIKQQWCKWSNSKSFTDWANQLNADSNYTGVYTKENALDNLASNFHLEINGKAIDLYKFFLEYMPFKVN